VLAERRVHVIIGRQGHNEARNVAGERRFGKSPLDGGGGYE
jgi:hypothetical protein